MFTLSGLLQVTLQSLLHYKGTSTCRVCVCNYTNTSKNNAPDLNHACARVHAQLEVWVVLPGVGVEQSHQVVWHCAIPTASPQPDHITTSPPPPAAREEVRRDQLLQLSEPPLCSHTLQLSLPAATTALELPAKGRWRLRER